MAFRLTPALQGGLLYATVLQHSVIACAMTAHRIVSPHFQFHDISGFTHARADSPWTFGIRGRMQNTGVLEFVTLNALLDSTPHPAHLTLTCADTQTAKLQLVLNGVSQHYVLFGYWIKALHHFCRADWSTRAPPPLLPTWETA